MRNDQLLKSYLDSFEVSVVEKTDLDLCAHTVSMYLRMQEQDGSISKHTVVFEGVSSFYFVAGLAENRFDRPTWEYAELGAIYHFAGSIGRITYHPSPASTMPEYWSSFNFALELWSSVLFIEASAISIDEKRFVIDRPQM